MDCPAITAACQPTWAHIECYWVYCGILRPSSQLLNALCSVYVEYSNNRSFFRCSGHFVSVWTNFKCTYYRFMCLDPLFLLSFNGNLNLTQFFGRIGEDEYISHGAHGTQSLWVGTCLYWVQYLKVSKVEDKYFGLKDNNASFWIDSHCFDLWPAANLVNTFSCDYIRKELQSYQSISLFFGCLGVFPPPTNANKLVLCIIYMMPIPAPKSLLRASVISS